MNCRWGHCCNGHGMGGQGGECHRERGGGGAAVEKVPIPVAEHHQERHPGPLLLLAPLNRRGQGLDARRIPNRHLGGIRGSRVCVPARKTFRQGFIPCGDEEDGQAGGILDNPFQGIHHPAKAGCFLIQAGSGKVEDAITQCRLRFRCPAVQGKFPCEQFLIVHPHSQRIPFAHERGEGVLHQGIESGANPIQPGAHGLGCLEDDQKPALDRGGRLGLRRRLRSDSKPEEP